jgi:hypothetical protein
LAGLGALASTAEEFASQGYDVALLARWRLLGWLHWSCGLCDAAEPSAAA